MAFCNAINEIFNWIQFQVDFLYSLVGVAPPDYAEIIGSIFGCDVV
jgi:hypothetical protein